MSSQRAPSVAKQSSSLAGRIKPIFPSSRWWSSTGRENYRIYPRKSPFQTGLEWVTERSRRCKLHGLGSFCTTVFVCFRLCCPCMDGSPKINPFLLLQATQYGNWLLGLAAHLIPHHHRLIQHSLIWRPACILHDMVDHTPRSNKTGISYHQSKKIHHSAFSFCLHDECMTERGGCVLYFIWAGGWEGPVCHMDCEVHRGREGRK